MLNPLSRSRSRVRSRVCSCSRSGGRRMRSRRASSFHGARKQPRAVTAAAVRAMELPGSGASGPEARTVRSSSTFPSAVRAATVASIVRTSPFRPAASVKAIRSPGTGSGQGRRQSPSGTERCRRRGARRRWGRLFPTLPGLFVLLRPAEQKAPALIVRRWRPVPVFVPRGHGARSSPAGIRTDCLRFPPPRASQSAFRGPLDGRSTG